MTVSWSRHAVEVALARREPYVMDYRIVHADGELRWVRERGRGVFDADGRALFLDGVLFDHTAQWRVRGAVPTAV